MRWFATLLLLLVGVGPAFGQTTWNITINGVTNELRLLEDPANGTDYVGFKAPANVPAPLLWTLPATDGNNGDLLTTDGAGTLTWAAGSGASGITSLNGLSTGVQTVSPGTTNIDWTSAVSTHTFTWTGQLSPDRGGTGQDSSIWNALPLVTAGVWGQYGGSSCGAGDVVTSIDSSGVVTCVTTGGTGTVTNTGTLTANAFLLGNGGADIVALPLTGIVVGHGASAPTGFAGSSCPGGQVAASIGVSGTLGCVTGGTGTVTHNAGALASGVPIVGNGGGDVTIFSGTQGSILFSGAAGVLSQDNANLNYNASTKAVSLGGKLARYNGNLPSNGQLLMGNAVTGTWDPGSLSCTSGVSCSFGAGSISISATGGSGGLGPSVVNVVNFGASSSASASTNVAAFQAAHDALPASGGGIFCPPGNYEVNSPIHFTKPVMFFGLSGTSGPSTQNHAVTPAGCRLVAATLLLDPILEVSVPGSNYEAAQTVVIRDVIFDVDPTLGSPKSAGAAVTITGPSPSPPQFDCGTVWFDHVQIRKHYDGIKQVSGCGLRITDSMIALYQHVGLTIENDAIPDGGLTYVVNTQICSVDSAASTPIKFVSGSSVNISNNYFCGNSAPGFQMVNATGGSFIHLVGNTFDGPFTDTISLAISGPSFDRTVIANNSLMGNTGIKIRSSGAGRFRNVAITGNTISANVACIDADAVLGGTVSGNDCPEATATGVNVGTSSSNVRVGLNNVSAATLPVTVTGTDVTIQGYYPMTLSQIGVNLTGVTNGSFVMCTDCGGGSYSTCTTSPFNQGSLAVQGGGTWKCL